MTKTYRQIKAYNKMIDNHNKYKKELLNTNPRCNRYIFLLKKINNTDPIIKYKNTEKQIEKVKLEKEKKEKEIIEKERIEKERIEKERIEKIESERFEILSDSSFSDLEN